MGAVRIGVRQISWRAQGRRGRTVSTAGYAQYRGRSSTTLASRPRWHHLLRTRPRSARASPPGLHMSTASRALHIVRLPRVACSSCIVRPRVRMRREPQCATAVEAEAEPAAATASAQWSERTLGDARVGIDL